MTKQLVLIHHETEETSWGNRKTQRNARSLDAAGSNVCGKRDELVKMRKPQWKQWRKKKDVRTAIWQERLVVDYGFASWIVT